MDTPNGCKVAEAINDDAVVEIWKTSADGKIYFDVVCRAEVEVERGRTLSAFLRGGDIPALVIAVVRAMEYISVCHREIRRSGPEAELPAMMDIRTTWDTREDSGTVVEPRVKQLKEIKCGAIVTELYEQERDHSEELSLKVIRCRREFPADGQWRRSEFIQQRDLRDLIISATEIWKHLAHPVEGNFAGARGGFYRE